MKTEIEEIRDELISVFDRLGKEDSDDLKAELGMTIIKLENFIDDYAEEKKVLTVLLADVRKTMESFRKERQKML